jgi:hypothetical protein
MAMAQRKGLQIGFTGFAFSLAGVALGLYGFHIDERWMSVAGFVVTGIGVLVGFTGIVYGWITEGKRAIGGSVEAARELRNKIERPPPKGQ